MQRIWHQRSWEASLLWVTSQNHCQEPPASLQVWPRGQRLLLFSSFLVSSLKLFQSASANKPTRLPPHLLPVLLPLSGYYNSPKSSKGQSCQSDWLHVGHYLMPTPTPLINCSWPIFVVSSVLVPWSE